MTTPAVRPTRLPWHLSYSGYCRVLSEVGLACMLCDAEPAASHVQVEGDTVWAGRLVAVLCIPCRRDVESGERREDLNRLLARQVVDGLLDLADGGPGSSGAPEARHGDHLDPLPQRC